MSEALSVPNAASASKEAAPKSMIPEHVKFIHVRKPLYGKTSRPFERPKQNNKGGITLAYTITPLVDPERGPGFNVAIGAAFCSPLDNYSRPKGRSLSSVRLKTQPLTFFFRQNESTIEGYPSDGDIVRTFWAWVIAASSIVEWDMRPIRTRFKHRLTSEVISLCAPGGSVRVEFDTTLRAKDGRDRDDTPKNRGYEYKVSGWIGSTPDWLKGYMREALT